MKGEMEAPPWSGSAGDANQSFELVNWEDALCGAVPSGWLRRDEVPESP